MGQLNIGNMLVENLQGSQSPRKLNHTWKKNTQMDLSDIGCAGVDCIYLVQDVV